MFNGTYFYVSYISADDDGCDVTIAIADASIPSVN